MTTIHTRQLQQYTRPNQQQLQNNLKLATIHVRQVRIQHVQKVKTPKREKFNWEQRVSTSNAGGFQN